MLTVLGRLRPGWYLLIALAVYAVIATVWWRVNVVELRALRLDVAGGAVQEGQAAVGDPLAAPVVSGGDSALGGGGPAVSATPLAGDVGLWFPIPGARVPSDDTHLPGAERAYRSGVSEGFVFWASSAGVPVSYGTPVVAAGDGVVVRADEPYAEMSESAWEALLAAVADGAGESELDRLRGRQVWLRLDDGRMLRYGHLSAVRSGLAVGQRVTRGRVIAFVGNSGTLDGVLARENNPRLHFEIRDADDDYVGEGLDPDGVRLLAASLFTGP